MSKALAAVIGLIALGGCARPPAEAFVGTWEVESTLSLNGSSMEVPETLTLEISPGEGADQVALDGLGCPMTGTVSESYELTIDPVTCPARQSAACQRTSGFTAGTGSLRCTTFVGCASISVELAGVLTSICDGETSEHPFTQKLEGSRTPN